MHRCAERSLATGASRCCRWIGWRQLLDCASPLALSVGSPPLPKRQKTGAIQDATARSAGSWSQCMRKNESGLSMNPRVLPASCRQTSRKKALSARRRQHLGSAVSPCTGTRPRRLSRSGRTTEVASMLVTSAACRERAASPTGTRELRLGRSEPNGASTGGTMRIPTFNLIFFASGSLPGAIDRSSAPDTAVELRLASTCTNFKFQIREGGTRMYPPARVIRRNFTNPHSSSRASAGFRFGFILNVSPAAVKPREEEEQDCGEEHDFGEEKEIARADKL